MTTISSISAVVPMRASRTLDTTTPTVAASLRAGTTRLTVRPVAAFEATSSSSDLSRQSCVRWASHASTRSCTRSVTCPRLLTHP